MRSVSCKCENLIETDLPELIDLATRPETYEEIRHGSFQNLTCDRCGLNLKPELPVRLQDSVRGLDLQFLPETERSDYLMGRIPVEAPRLAIGYRELAEKIRLLDAGLDDGAVEILKFFLKKKTGNDDAQIFFQEIRDGHLVFHIYGIREDEIALSRLPLPVYRDTLASLSSRSDRELYAVILAPPYVSANKVSIQEEE